MKIAVFDKLLDAGIYRHNHGGWLFIAGTEYIWFDAAEYTPSAIMLHHITRGYSSELICDDRYYKPRRIET